MLRLMEPARTHRSRLVVGLAVLVTAATALVVSPLASAAPATVTITADWVTSSVAVPAARDKYLPFVLKDVAFTVHFHTDVALSTTASTRLTLSAGTGRNKSVVLGTLDVEPNVTEGDIPAASGLPTAANGVTLTISAKGSGVTPGTIAVDVVGKYVTTSSTSCGQSPCALTGIGAGGGPGVPCEPTSTIGDQTCGDLVIPANVPVPDQLLTQGLCDTTPGAANACRFSGGSVLQWLATLSGVENTNPVTFIAKCDKSLCAGKGVSSYAVKVQTKLTDAPTASLPCAAKGVVDFGKEFCTDYVQSKRDGAGDLLLYVLFAADAKIIW